jgi:hypothetical protein
LKILLQKFRIPFLIAVVFISVVSKVNAQYAVGDYGSTSSGNWGAAIWSTWNGASWTATGSSPSAGNNVFILAGRTVTLTTQSSCLNLTVEATGKLWTANNLTNVYLYVYGASILCDGQIGDGATFDGISFGFEGASCTITGSGLFDASRMRKNTAGFVTTNLIISRNINLRFNTATTTQIYNATNNSYFNVTVSVGATLSLVASGPNTGNACIDGLDGTAVALNAAGSFTINGTMIVSGKIFMTTNNPAPYACSWIINGLVQVNEIVASNSGLGGHSLTVNNGGKLEITGTAAFSALGITNNAYTFNNGSTVEYSAAGTQNVRVRSEFTSTNNALSGYYNLICSNTGLKQTLLIDLWVRNDLTISGSAVLDPNPAINTIYVGGNWLNYNQSGFNEKNTTVQVNGTGTQNITCPGGEIFNILRYGMATVPTTNHLQFNSPVDIITQLWFTSNGYVDLNSNTLTIRNNGTTGINGQTSTRYIYSEKTDNSSKIVWKIGAAFAAGPYTFPFGMPPGGAANYVPVIVYKTTAIDIGDLSFATYGTPPNNQPWPTTPTNVTNLWAFYQSHNVPDNRHWTVDRFWEIGSTNPNNIDTIRVSYRTVELPDSDQTPSNLAAQFWATNFNSWNILQYGTGAANYVSIYPNVNPTVYYNTSWTLTSLTSPLPIKLLSFDAMPEEKEVKLKWITATEINNAFFTLEKSVDGNKFFPIGTVPGAGNSTSELVYAYSDSDPVYGISYYRLRQTDYDGHSTVSNIVPVSYKKTINKYSVFPNPVYDKAYIISGKAENATLTLRNIEGRLISTTTLEGSELIYPLELDGLSKGVYFIEVRNESETQFIRVIKN